MPQRFVSALEEQLERAEESAHPLALDLDTDDGLELKRLTRELWPRVTAAQALLLPELASAGQKLVPCNDRSARYSLWKEGSDGLPLASPRVRQRAWAHSTLAMLRSSEVQKLAARLRELAAEPTSAIALVIEPTAAVDGLSRLSERARKLQRRAGRSARPAPAVLGLLAQSRGSVERPIVLGPRDLVAVPRLGALARLSDFAAEIERALTPGDRWLKRPEVFESGRSSSERVE